MGVREDQHPQQVAPIAKRQNAGAVGFGRQDLGGKAAAIAAAVTVLAIDEKGLAVTKGPLQALLLETGVIDDARFVALMLIDQIALEAVGGGVVLGQTQAADTEVVLQDGKQTLGQLGDAHQFNHRIGHIHQNFAAVALKAQGVGLLQGALLVEHVLQRNGDDGGQLGQLGQGLHGEAIELGVDKLDPAQMAASGGDGELAVRAQPRVDPFAIQCRATILKTGGSENDGLFRSFFGRTGEACSSALGQTRCFGPIAPMK